MTLFQRYGEQMGTSDPDPEPRQEKVVELEPGRKPCTHCGDCCRTEVCPVGRIFTRTTTPPCPALAKDRDGKFWCGLVVCPETAMYTGDENEHANEDERYWARKLGQFLKEHVFNFGAGCDRY